MIYLDTSAAYKLLSREPGVEEVQKLFVDGTELLSSRLLEVELHATFDRELAAAAQQYGLEVLPGRS